MVKFLPSDSSQDRQRPTEQEVQSIISAFVSGALVNANEAAQSLTLRYPEYPFGWKALGMVLNQMGHFEEALIPLKEAIRLAPHDADVWNTLGSALRAAGHHDGAIKAYQEAVLRNAGHAEAYCNLGNALRDLNRLDEAMAACRNAITLRPELSEAHYNLGVTLKQRGLLEEAIPCYQRILSLRPGFANAWNNLGDALFAKGAIDEARESFLAAIRHDPRHVMARVNLGNLLRSLKQFAKAEEIFREALVIQPDHAEALGNWGNVLRDLKRFHEAHCACSNAIRINPRFFEAHSNLGNILRDLGLIDASLDAYRTAITLQPGFAEAYYNLGISSYRAGSTERSHISYQRAQKLKCVFPEVNLNLGFLYLSEGRYREGWPLYEWRFRYPDFGLQRRVDVVPEWDGVCPLSGRTILLYAEQGLGDTIQFSRFAQVIRRMGANVVLEVQPALVKLLSRLCRELKVVSHGEMKKGYDFHYPLMSLPLVLDTTIETIPPVLDGFSPDLNTLERWSTFLGEKRKPRVGMVLSGNPDHVNDLLRSIPWHHATPLLSECFEFFCLQKELKKADLDFFNHKGIVRLLSHAIDDFDDTAALCRLMDLVISVDTSVAHLAASLGRPTWVILPTMPDWRWMLNREDSLWYPSVRLLRKNNDIGWGDFLSKIGKDMEAELCNPNLVEAHERMRI